MAEVVREVDVQRKPVTIQRDFFLCYECGETFQIRAKYEEHVLLHQAILFCYQIYEYETEKVFSNVGIECDKSFKKSNLSRRNSFPDFARKRENQFFDLSANVRRKSAYPVLRDDQNEGRRSSVGRPHKRKRGEAVGTSTKLVKTDRLNKQKTSVEGEISFFGDIDNNPSSAVNSSSRSNLSTAIGVLQKNEEIVKDCLSDDRSCDASFPALSTTSSSGSSASSSASTTSSSSFFSPSSDSSSASSDSILCKKKGVTKTRRVNRDRDKGRLKEKKNSAKNSSNTCVDEESKVTEVGDDFVRASHGQEKDIAVGNEADCAKGAANEGTCSSCTGQQCKLRCKTKRRCEDMFRNRSMKSDKADKKLLSEFRNVDKKSRTSRIRTHPVRTNNLKDGDMKNDNSPLVKNEGSKPNIQPFNSSCSLGQKCVACDFVSFQGTEMIEHVTRKHDASVVRLEKKDCVKGVWSESNEIKADEKCSLCDLVFDNVSDYLIHVILLHKPSLFAPGADRFTCTAHLAHPHLPTHKINITLKRPQVA